MTTSQPKYTPHPTDFGDISDLVVGRVYAPPAQPNLEGLQREPLSKLLFAVDPSTKSMHTDPSGKTPRISNSGGIRTRKSLRNQKIKSGIALISTSKEIEWQDEIRTIEGVRHLIYHGDSRKSGDPTKVDGNAELLNVFGRNLADEEIRTTIPLFLAFKNTTGNPLEYEFLGVAVPGSPVLPVGQWVQRYDARNESGEAFSNYKYVFTLLECPKVDGVWVRAAFFGISDLSGTGAPQELRDWVTRGEVDIPHPIRALSAEHETVDRVAQTGKQDADHLVDTLRSRLFAGNRSAVNPETAADQAHKRADFVDSSWYDDVVALAVPETSGPKVVVLLGGPGNGKSSLAQCLIRAAREQGMGVEEGVEEPSIDPREAARRIINLSSASGPDREIRIVNDASIPAEAGETLYDVLGWVEAKQQGRKALLCVNRGALVEEAAELVRSKDPDGAAVLRLLGNGERSLTLSSGVQVKVIEMDKESTLAKMLAEKNKGPWGTLVAALRDSFAADTAYRNSVFHQNAEELNEYLFGFYSMLLEAESHRGLKMTYRDIWSAVGAFLIGSESTRRYTDPRDVVCGKVSDAEKILLDCVGYCALYGHGWLQGEKVVVDVAALSPVEEALRATDPALQVTAEMCTKPAMEDALKSLHTRYPALRVKETSALALKTALAYRMQRLRSGTALSSQQQPTGGALDSRLAMFGYLKDDIEAYRAGFNVLGNPKKDLPSGDGADSLKATEQTGVVRWSSAHDCGVTVHASSDYLAAAALCTQTQVGLRAESISYVHALERVGRANSLGPVTSDAPAGLVENDTVSEVTSVQALNAPQQIPLPEMLIADVLIAANIGYTYKSTTTRSKENRVFLDKDGRGKNIESERPAHLSARIAQDAGIEHWSDLSAPSRLRGSGAGALPLTPSLAIMQRQRANLPSFAETLEYIYQAGLASIEPPEVEGSAAFDNLAVVTARILQKNSSTHKGLRRIEECLSGFLDDQGRPVYGIREGAVPATRNASANLPRPRNPYEWFVVSLAALDRLAGRIPPVVCAEWLTAIYRTAFGMGYLHAYTLGKGSHPKEDNLFSWTSSERSVGERTVLGALRKLVSAGEGWSIRAKNRYEAVCYMLQSLSPDDRLHMLTKSYGKASGVPEPGLGWVDMVVMLAAEVGPREENTIELYYVHEYIKALRVQPPMAELIRLCKRNGLLTGAVPPDADGALKVYTPYTLSSQQPNLGAGPGREKQSPPGKDGKNALVFGADPAKNLAGRQDEREVNQRAWYEKSADPYNEARTKQGKPALTERERADHIERIAKQEKNAKARGGAQ